MRITETGAVRLDASQWIDLFGVEVDETGHPIDIGYDDDRVAIYPDHIWTKLDLDMELEELEMSEEADIVNGARWVNRMEYYFSKKPFNLKDNLEVY